MKPVFFYGLFMDPDLLRSEGYNPGPLQIAKLNNYHLKLGTRATLVPDPAGEAWGTIMSLPPEELDALYSAPSVADYQPTAVKCITENDLEAKADVYILNPDDPLEPPADATYARKLLTIAEKVGLPLKYLQELETLIKKIEE